MGVPYTVLNEVESNECPARRTSITFVDRSLDLRDCGAMRTTRSKLQRRSSPGNVVAQYRVIHLGVKGIRPTVQTSELVVSHSTVDGPVEAERPERLEPSDGPGGSKHDQYYERYHTGTTQSVWCPSSSPSFVVLAAYLQSIWNKRAGRGTETPPIE